MEMRKDYILNRWVFYAGERKKRKREFKEDKTIEKSVCFFCPGNENLTPKEIGRINNPWRVRWFPNKFPMVDTKKKLKFKKSKLFNSGYSYGYMEVIVETPDHETQLSDLPVKNIKEVLWVYSERIKDLSKKPGVKYVDIFKNHGKRGGASLKHSHTQLSTLPIMPALVQEEINASKKKCPFCDIIKKEKEKKVRIAYENKTFIAIAPYASRFNYELWFLPKRHVKSITELKDNELMELAEMLKKALLKVKTITDSYNYYLHYSPDKQDLHFHIELAPRIEEWAGLEFSTGFVINLTLPEEAAKFYR